MMRKVDLGSTVLVPILSKREHETAFLDSALSDCSRVVLLAVIDQGSWSGQFGFVATEIRAATDLVEKLKVDLVAKGFAVEDLVEWGQTVQKIAHVAEMKSCSRIALVKEEGKHFDRLVNELKAATTIPVFLIGLPSVIPPEL